MPDERRIDRHGSSITSSSRGRPVVLVSEPDEVERARRQAARTDPGTATTRRSQGQSRCADPSRLDRRAGTTSAPARAGDRARDARSLDGSRTPHRARQPAIEFAGRVPDWVGGDPPRPRRRRDDALRRRNAGRAERDDRAARRNTTSSPCRSSAPRTRAYAAVLVGVGRLSRGFRLPDAGLQLYAETDVFEEERRAPRAAPLGDARRSSPTSAISRSAISSSTSITASACSSA